MRGPTITTRDAAPSDFASQEAPARRGAEDYGLRPPRPLDHRRARVLAALAITVLLGGVVRLGAEAAPREGGPVVGHPLRLSPGGPFMETVHAPARISRVAVVPGSPAGEAWGISHSYAQKPGYDKISVEGQSVFARYTREGGWQVYGPPLDEAGKPLVAQLASIAMAPSGEGWAVGGFGRIYHRRPGDHWRLDPQASSITTKNLSSVALGMDAAGLYGYAVGEQLAMLRLTADGWRADLQNSAIPATGAPGLVSVDAFDREHAIAVADRNQLVIMLRDHNGWAPKQTGRPIFDSPPAPVLGSGGTGTINQYARGGAVAAAGRYGFVSGEMQPVDPARPTGETDRTRPFVLRYDRNRDVFDAYCPPIYQLSGSGVESTVAVCENPFPLGNGDLPALDAFPNGEAMAGGQGLFRFSGGRWTRLPNTLGFLVSASFHSPDEGWVTTPGNSVSRGGTAFTSTIAVGHWTRRPLPQRMRRWPQPATEHLEDVAAHPADHRVVLAVGAHGTALRLEPGVGWDVVATKTAADLHGVSWPSPDAAWAVGAEGTILRYDGRVWAPDPASGKLTSEPLLDVVFDSPSRGWAVGTRGTILHFDGAGWSKDPASGRVTDKRLNAVGVAGRAVVIAGDGGTILLGDGRGWAAQKEIPDLIRSGQEGRSQNLLAVAGLDDGTVYVAGARGVLLERRGDEKFKVSSLPDLDGSIHTLRAWRDGASVRFLASIGETSGRYSGPGLVEPAGSLFVGDPSGWRPLTTGRALSLTPNQDAGADTDAVYGVVMDPSGRTGWAVGGSPAEVPDSDGHASLTSTSSVWRLALDASPAASPAEDTAPVGVPAGAVGFAFLGDSSCATGLCSAVVGSGSRADVVLLEALRDIDALAADGHVAFVVHGGDARRNGVPDDLGAARELLGDLRVPAFAALGDKDLFAGLGPSAASGATASAGYYQRLFAGAPAPWGTGPPPRGFVPVSVPGESAPDPGAARTHYAFDYRPGGQTLLRAVVLDTSRVPLATSSQNPPEDQTAWLQTVLRDAQTNGIPALVFMHQPVVLPVSTLPEASTITTALTTFGASAVLASHQRTNRYVLAPSGDVPDPFPVAVTGGAGSPLEGDWRLNRGAYHAWHHVLVKVDPDARSALGRAPVAIRPMPVLSSAALSALEGRRVGAGDALRFRALGRLPDVGGAHANGASPDLGQSRSTYLPFPMPATCAPLENPDQSGCVEASVARPYHRFLCEDATMCAFVLEDPAAPGRPFRDAQHRLVPDPHGGFMCAFRPGRTEVRFEAGTVAARVPVEIGGGAGPCIPGDVQPLPDPFAPPIEAAVAATTTGPDAWSPAPKEPATPTHLLRPKAPDVAAVAAVAPPLVNAAPAPPATGSGQKQEEREAATERAEMTALDPARRLGYETGIAVTGLLIITAAALAVAVRPRPRPRAAPVITRRNEE